MTAQKTKLQPKNICLGRMRRAPEFEVQNSGQQNKISGLIDPTFLNVYKLFINPCMTKMYVKIFVIMKF